VEVIGDAAAFTTQLVARGLAARTGTDGSILIEIDGGSPFDAVRDTAAETGVGLLRIGRRRDRLEDLFGTTSGMAMGATHVES
jgi:ABC-2 type transport system ATP-binding protein